MGMKKTIDLGNFTEIVIAALVEATIQQGAKNTITLIGEESDMQQIRLAVAQATLYVESKAQQSVDESNTCSCCCGLFSVTRTTNGNRRIQQKAVQAIITTTSALQALAVRGASNAALEFDMQAPQCIASASGSAQVTLKSVVAQNTFTTEASGSSTITAASIQAPALVATLSGSAELICKGGQTNALTLTTNGASELKGEALTANTADITSSGSSEVTINVTSHLKANASGAASIRYSGNPSLERTVSGAGSIGKM